MEAELLGRLSIHLRTSQFLLSDADLTDIVEKLVRFDEEAGVEEESKKVCPLWNEEDHNNNIYPGKEFTSTLKIYK